MQTNKKRTTGFIIFGGIVALLMLFFFLSGTSTVLYFGARSVVHSVKAKYFPGTTTTENTADKKETKKEDLSGKEQITQETNLENTQNEKSLVKKLMIKTSGGLVDFPTEMKGNYGMCVTPAGHLRSFILTSIEKRYRQTHPADTTFMRGCHTSDHNVKVSYEGEYSYVDGNISPTAIPQKDNTTKYFVNFCAEFWPNTGHYPALPIEAGSMSASSPLILANWLGNGWNIGYEVEYK